MTEWDKLKAEMDTILVDLSDIGFAIEFSKLWNKLEAEGDKLQSHLACCQEGYKMQMEAHHEVKQKLEAIRTIVSIPDVWTHPDPTKAIREVLSDE